MNIPKFSAGDTLRLSLKIVEAGKERLQPFEGVVLAKKGSGINETFTLRRVSYGEGLERIFLLLSPSIARIEVIQTGRVKRAKLYYLRKRAGKKARIEEKIVSEAEAESGPSTASELPSEESLPNSRPPQAEPGGDTSSGE